MRQSKIVTALLVLPLAGIAFGADKKIISPPGTKPGGKYSQGILIDGTLYISGQGGEDAAGKIPSDFDAEVRQSFDNIQAVLKAAGMSPADVVSVQVYLNDAGKFQRMNAVYKVISEIRDPPGRQ
jgi:2-iminobutanoate/2-iminopropanoate deaminase